MATAQIPRAVTVNLTPPTSFEDGSALNCVSAGCKFNVYRGECGKTLTKVVAEASSVAIPVPNTAPGQCFHVTTVVDGVESLPSSQARYKGKPGAPTITVVVTITMETE